MELSRSLRLSVPVALAICGAASAVTVSGTSTTTLLVTDRPTTTVTPLTRAPLYENVSFLLGDMASQRLTFVGSFRGWRDLKGTAPDKGDFRVYHAYFRWNDRASGLEVDAGRQFVLDGVARTYLDGLRAQKRMGDWTTSAFFGQPLRNDIDGAEHWDKQTFQWGARAQWRTTPALRLSMSYTEMRYGSATGLRLIGAAGTYMIDDHQFLRIRADVDAATPALDRAFAVWTYAPSSGRSYSVEGSYRQAQLWDFSALRDISSGGYAQATVTATQPVPGNIRGFLAVSALNADGSVGSTVDLGAYWHTLRIGYLFASTGAITGSGLYVNGSYRLNDLLTVGGRTNFTSYETVDASAAAQSLGSAVFATVTPIRALDITGEVRHIMDDQFTYQFEGLVSVAYRFEHLRGR